MTSAAVPPPLALRAAADPARVGAFRRALRRWLVGLPTPDGLGAARLEDLLDDLVLAASEALENVVDHAFAETAERGTMTLLAELRERVVVVVIADDGRWRDPSDGPSTRGRGLPLMYRLASTSVERSAGGTTVTLRRDLRDAPDRSAAQA